jgi:hypothetical protein
LKLSDAQKAILGMLDLGFHVSANVNPNGSWSGECEELPVQFRKISTIRNLEIRGLIECANPHAEAWRTYLITDAGKAALHPK